MSLRLPLVALLAVTTTGCLSYWRGQEIATEVTALEGQVEQLRESQRQQDQALAQRLDAVETSLQTIQGAIDGLRTGGADYGLELERVRDELKAVNGELAEIKHRLKSTAPAPVTVTPADGTEPAAAGVAAAPLPEEPADLYRYGWERKKAEDCDEAIRAFQQFSTKFSGNQRADNAIFLMAECLYVKQAYAESIRSLHRIIQQYPEGDKIDDALLLLHDNFIALGKCKDALPFIETLLAEHPRSSLVAEARKKQSQTRRNCK